MAEFYIQRENFDHGAYFKFPFIRAVSWKTALIKARRKYGNVRTIYGAQGEVLWSKESS